MNWPKLLDCQDFGKLKRVYLNSDESWYCQYQRIEDSQYFISSDKLKTLKDS